MIDKRRENYIEDIYFNFKKLIDLDNDKIRVYIKTATKLQNEQIANISSYLESKINKKLIISEIIDESIGMGFIINVGGIEIDATVNSSFNRLKNELKKIEVKLW